MNERIRELALQAKLGSALLLHHWGTVDALTDSEQNELEQIEKFAQLIVAECGNWFNDRLVVNPDYGIEHRVERNRAVVGVMKEFNQHFG